MISKKDFFPFQEKIDNTSQCECLIQNAIEECYRSEKIFTFPLDDEFGFCSTSIVHAKCNRPLNPRIVEGWFNSGPIPIILSEDMFRQK